MAITGISIKIHRQQLLLRHQPRKVAKRSLQIRAPGSQRIQQTGAVCSTVQISACQ